MICHSLFLEALAPPPDSKGRAQQSSLCSGAGERGPSGGAWVLPVPGEDLSASGNSPGKESSFFFSMTISWANEAGTNLAFIHAQNKTSAK